MISTHLSRAVLAGLTNYTWLYWGSNLILDMYLIHNIVVSTYYDADTSPLIRERAEDTTYYSIRYVLLLTIPTATATAEGQRVAA